MTAMKRYFLSLLTLTLSFAVFAAPRSEEQAKEIAYNHFCQNGNTRVKAKALSARPDLILAGTSSSLLGKGYKAKASNLVSTAEALYVYNLGQEAYVIVSGDDVAEPILAFGNEGAFDTGCLPDNLRYWLQTYADEMEYALAHPATGFATRAGSSANAMLRSDLPEHVEPLMTYGGKRIQWDQNEPFYNDCPKFQGYISVAGCVATALAQIVYYHRWPAKGQGGRKNYITATHRLSQDIDFNSLRFDYDQMLPRYYHGSFTEEQGAEAARLTHALGVAVEMDYSPSGSGALSMDVGNAMVKHFGYDKNIHYAIRDFFTLDEWVEMIKTELSQGRPICYAGTSKSVGHQFVFEGYDKDNLVYVNWGWAGMSDGYFRLSALAPSSLGTGGGTSSTGGFIFNQAMWIGMQAPSEESLPGSFFIVDGESVEVDKTHLFLGQELTLSTKNYYNGSVDFCGDLCMILENTTNGIQTELSDSKSMKVNSGAGFKSTSSPVLSFSGILPVGTDDGDYLLYTASRIPEEPRWSRIRTRAGYNDRYLVRISEGSATIMPVVTEPKGEGSLTSDHAIYTRCRSKFTARVRNTGTSEYFGLAHVAVYHETNGSIDLIALCGEEQVSLPVGEEVDILFNAAIEAMSGKTLTTGDYKACVIVEHQDKYIQISDPIDINIKRMPSGMASLTLTDIQVHGINMAMDGLLSGSFEVKNTRSVYSGELGIIVFADKASSGSLYWDTEVFLEKDNTERLTFSIPAQWLPGKYKASIRYNEGYTNEIGSFEFEIEDRYDGMEAPRQDKVADEVYYTLSGTRLDRKPDHGPYIVNGKKIMPHSKR